MKVQRDAELVTVPGGAHPLHREAVAEQEVVCRGERSGAVFVSRGVDAEAVTHQGRDPGLVQGDPEPNIIREGLVHDAGVLCEAFARIPVSPAAQVLQRLRQVPVVEREHRLYGTLPQAVDEPAVEVEALLVGRTAPLWLDAGPGHREAVGLHPELGHQVEVFFQAVVLVAGYVTRVAVMYLTRSVAERVPDRGAAAVFVYRALDLVGGRSRAPQKVLREAHGSFLSTPYYTGERVTATSLARFGRLCTSRRLATQRQAYPLSFGIARSSARFELCSFPVRRSRPGFGSLTSTASWLWLSKKRKDAASVSRRTASTPGGTWAVGLTSASSCQATEGHAPPVTLQDHAPRRTALEVLTPSGRASPWAFISSSTIFAISSSERTLGAWRSSMAA